MNFKHFFKSPSLRLPPLKRGSEGDLRLPSLKKSGEGSFGIFSLKKSGEGSFGIFSLKKSSEGNFWLPPLKRGSEGDFRLLSLKKEQKGHFLNLVASSLLLSLSVNLSAAETIRLTPEQITQLGVQIASLKPSVNIPLLTAPAKVVVPPAQEHIISAPQAGLVTQLGFAVGDTVNAGQLVAQLNSPEILTLQQQYLHSENQRQLAATNYRRDKNLFAEGVIAQKRWQETSSQYASLESDSKSFRQMLQISGLSTAQIQNLTKTGNFNSQINLYSPITGVVLEKMTSAGERLNSLSPLYRIAKLSTLWLEIAIAHEKIAQIQVGDEVAILNTPITAKIVLLGNSVNPSNQSVLVRAVINQSNPAVRVGQAVTIQLVRANTQTAFTVPSTAVAQNSGKSYLFVRSQTGFNVVPIAVIAKQGIDLLFTGALKGTEQVASKGAVALKALWLGLGEAE